MHAKTLSIFNIIQIHLTRFVNLTLNPNLKEETLTHPHPLTIRIFNKALTRQSNTALRHDKILSTVDYYAVCNVCE